MINPQPTSDRASALSRKERSRILRRFVALDREAALGAMASSVAHGINTPLMQVYSDVADGRERARRLQVDARGLVERGDVDGLQLQLKALLRCLDQVRADVLAVTTSTRDIGVFAQARSLAGVVQSPTSLLQAAIDLAENGIRHRARFTSELCELPPLRGSEEQLGHLFFAALMASMNAVPESGAANHGVSIRARSDGDAVVVEIEDTGVERHIPEDDEQALAAFLSPRSQTDVAMAVCRTLVSDLKGAMELTSMARGYRLRLCLMTATASAHAEVAPRSVPTPDPARRGRVLVIDDEATLLGLVCQILRLDHEVEGTVDPFEALAKVESGERYDVILCDLMMPAMNGVDLYQSIQRFAPHVASRMVFLSAGAFSERARSFLERTPVPYLEKPIEPDTLRAEVRARVAEAG